jgi:hypothetical protein
MKKNRILLTTIALLGALLLLSGCCGMFHHRHGEGDCGCKKMADCQKDGKSGKDCPQKGENKPCCPDTKPADAKPAETAPGK